MKCKNCKQQFEPFRFLQKYCFEHECVQVWIAKEKEKQWKAKKKQIKSDLLSVQDWVKIAQQTFNKWINLRDKGKPCISCQKPITGRVNASHFWNANNHWAVRFHPDNVHSSCVPCNQFLSGNLLAYQKNLIAKIGKENYDKLENLAKQTRKYSIHELKEITDNYKKKISLLLLY